MNAVCYVDSLRIRQLSKGICMSPMTLKESLKVDPEDVTMERRCTSLVALERITLTFESSTASKVRGGRGIDFPWLTKERGGSTITE